MQIDHHATLDHEPAPPSIRSQTSVSWTRASIRSFVTTIYLFTGAGIVYGFSAYGTQLRDRLGFSQLQLSMLASACNMGLYLSGPVTGLLVDKYGPQLISKISTWLMFIGFASITYAYETAHAPDCAYSPSTIAFYYFMIGSGSSGVTMSCLTLNIRTFHAKNRGFAVGVPLSFYGLSAFLFVQVKSIWFKTADSGDIAGFLVFITGYMGISILVAFMNMNEPPLASAPLTGDQYIVMAEDDEVPIMGLPEIQPHVSLYATLADFFSHLNNWLLIVAFFLAAGTGLMVISNIGAVVLSMSPKGSKSSDSSVQSAQVLQVAILSVFNALGRIISGLGSDFTGTGTRPWWLFSSLIVMSVASSIVAFELVPLENPTSWILCLSTSMIGYAYGTLWALTPPIVANLVAPIRFGFLWGIMTSVPAISQQLTNTLFGVLYDANRSVHATPGRTGDGLQYECYGPKCYTQAYTVTTILCLVGVICAFILASKWRFSARRTGGWSRWSIYDRVVSE